jgi:hypothetical protein
MAIAPELLRRHVKASVFGHWSLLRDEKLSIILVRGHPSMKTGAAVHRYFAAMRTGFYSCSRHIRYVRTPPLPLSVALEEQG